MKKLLLIGNAPLPKEHVKMQPAAGLRTWQFTKPLMRQGAFDISLFTIAMPEAYQHTVQKSTVRQSENFTRHICSKDDPRLLKHLQQIHDAQKPDAIIAVNTYPSFVASQMQSRAPLWADLNGWIMAEAQAQAFKTGSDDYLPHYHAMEKSILERADKFSTVSAAQTHALLGELAFLGRLNKNTFGYDFVTVIPNACHTMESPKNPAESTAKKFGLPENGFFLLWLGGYNTWVDEETLFTGVNRAMEACPDLYFISTGGALPGLDDKTFARFKNLVDSSPFKNRFRFLGWMDSQDIPELCKTVHAGLNVDRPCTETYFGGRNRINAMMQFGLPVISTLGTEISFEMAKNSAGIGIPMNDAEALANAIMNLHEDYKKNNGLELRTFGNNGEKYAGSQNSSALMEPLFIWLQNPIASPDRGKKIDLSRSSMAKSALLYLRQRGFKKFLQRARQHLLPKARAATK